MQKFTVKSTHQKSRVDVFIAEQYPQYARSALSKLFVKDLIKVNGKFAKRGNKLKAGDQVTVDNRLLKPPKHGDLPVIYEDVDVIVLDKPSGVLSHSNSSIETESSVASFVRSRVSGLSGNRAGIVHRLDRGTSGVMIAAKNHAAMKYLQKQFSDRRVEKTYIAIVEGVVSPPQGTVDIPISRSQSNPKLFIASKSGRNAKTTYHSLNTTTINGKKYTLLKLEPETGRTHQLRVHLKFLRRQIVGDTLYGNDQDHGRIMLHALSLKIKLPNGEHKNFEAPIPEEFSQYAN